MKHHLVSDAGFHGDPPVGDPLLHDGEALPSPAFGSVGWHEVRLLLTLQPDLIQSAIKNVYLLHILSQFASCAKRKHLCCYSLVL